jgi:hypothetical protein
LIKLDLIRRLEKFDKGLLLISEIKSMEQFILPSLNDLSNHYQDALHEFLKIQRELIKNKDTNIHTLPEHLGEPLFGSNGEGMIFMF